MNPSRALSWQADLLEVGFAETSRPSVRIPVRHVVVGSLVVAAGIGYTQMLRQTASKLSTQATAAETRVAKQSDAISHSTAAIAARQQSIVALEAEVTRERMSLRTIKDAVASAGSALTARSVLLTLSQQQQNGLWLTKIEIDRVGHQVVLEGVAPDARSVSQYIGSLGRDHSALSTLGIANVKGEVETAQPGSQSAGRQLGMKFLVRSEGIRP